MSPRDWRGLVALTAMAVLFGASFTAIKVALGSFTPFQLVFLRFLISSASFALLWPWIPKQRLSRGDDARLFGLALLEPGLYFYAEAEGVKRTLASTAAVLISTIPLFVLVLEALWLKVRILLAEVLLILVSLGGIYLLVAAGPGAGLGGTALGNGLILVSALGASVYTVLAKKILATVHPLTLTFYQSLFAAGLYLPFAAADTLRHTGPAPGRPAIAALLYLGVFCSFLAYALMNYSLSRMKASFAAAFANLVPVVGIALAYFALGERLVPVQLLGGAIVLTTMTALTLLAPTHVEGEADDLATKSPGKVGDS